MWKRIGGDASAVFIKRYRQQVPWQEKPRSLPGAGLLRKSGHKCLRCQMGPLTWQSQWLLRIFTNPRTDEDNAESQERSYFNWGILCHVCHFKTPLWQQALGCRRTWVWQVSATNKLAVYLEGKSPNLSEFLFPHMQNRHISTGTHSFLKNKFWLGRGGRMGRKVIQL